MHIRGDCTGSDVYNIVGPKIGEREKLLGEVLSKHPNRLAFYQSQSHFFKLRQDSRKNFDNEK